MTTLEAAAEAYAEAYRAKRDARREMENLRTQIDAMHRERAAAEARYLGAGDRLSEALHAMSHAASPEQREADAFASMEYQKREAQMKAERAQREREFEAAEAERVAERAKFGRALIEDAT